MVWTGILQLGINDIYLTLTNVFPGHCTSFTQDSFEAKQSQNGPKGNNTPDNGYWKERWA